VRRSRPILQWASQAAFGLAFYIVAMGVHGGYRALADNVNKTTYTIAPIEEALIGRTPAQWMQGWFGAENPVLSPMAFELWLSLFWMTPVLCAVAAFLGGKRAFYSLLAVHMAVMLSADTLYFLFPTRPPWMDLEVTRLIAIKTANATAFDTNPYASLPSLHVAVPAAYAIWFARQVDPRLRVLAPPLFAWVAGMSWAVMYTGEHYALCVVEGLLWAAAAHMMLPRLAAGIAAVRPRRPYATPAPAPAYLAIGDG
jgi:hypothetical protein